MKKNKIRHLITRVDKFNMELTLLREEIHKTLVEINGLDPDDKDLPMKYDWLSHVAKKISNLYVNFLK